MIRKQEGSQVIEKKSRLLSKRTTQLSKAEYPNRVWSYDLVSDKTACGRRYRCLASIDESTRYDLATHVGQTITSEHVKNDIDRVIAGVSER